MWVNSCQKHGYETKHKALIAKKHSQLAFGTLLSIYRCSECRLFHLTSKVHKIKNLDALPLSPQLKKMIARREASNTQSQGTDDNTTTSEDR